MKTKSILGIVMVLFLVNILNVMPALSQPTGMIAYWKFDEGDGTVAYDSVGSNDGTLKNGPVWTTGIVDGALSFDGVDDYVGLGDVLDPRTSDWTIEAWTKTSEPGMPIDKYRSWGPPYYGFYWNYAESSRSDFAVVDTDRNVVVARVTKDLIDGEWHHVAMIIDNTNDKVDVYVDGELSATAEGTINDIDTHYQLLFGRRWDDPHHNFWFNGLIDEVAIYDQVLTEEEIQQRYLSGLPVVARLERHHVYEASPFEDSVSNVVLEGLPKQSFYIWPLGAAIVTGAQMEMVTPYLCEPQYFPSIEWDPMADFTVEGPEGGPYTYLWEFGSISEQAAVWIQTNFPEEFQLPFACNRTWNPWITLETVIQTLTVVFEPSEPGGVHIQVRAESTDEASVEILSASSGPLWPLSNHWLDEEDGKVVGANWGGDCGTGTYIFYIEIEVVNEFFPEPIYYKPSVGLSLGLDTLPNDVDITEDSLTIWDDVDGDGDVSADERLTYSGSGDNNWQVIMKDDYDVNLPSYSRVVPFMAEGHAFVKLEEGFVRGSAFLVSGPTPPIPKYVYLNVGGQGFWWETTELSVRGKLISLKCEPVAATTGSPGPVPITVRITKPEEGRRVTASGPGVIFTGKITKIETPP